MMVGMKKPDDIGTSALGRSRCVWTGAYQSITTFLKGDNIMTLYQLIENTTLQGNIRISMWKGDTEVVLATWMYCDGLYSTDIEEELENLVISYIYASSDGFLHIEVEER